MNKYFLNNNIVYNQCELILKREEILYTVYQRWYYVRVFEMHKDSFEYRLWTY